MKLLVLLDSESEATLDLVNDWIGWMIGDWRKKDDSNLGYESLTTCINTHCTDISAGKMQIRKNCSTANSKRETLVAYRYYKSNS